MKEEYSRLAAVIAYLPVIGWLYVYFAGRSNKLAMFHLRQSVGLVLFLLGTMAAWIVIAWLLAWIPFMAALSAALFAIVLGAYIFGAFAWLMGIANAGRHNFTPLPGFGNWAEELPIQ
jgi:uncharacterized membrane protein